MRNEKEFKKDAPAPAEDMIEGRNAVTEAIRSGRTINKVFLADGDTDRALGRLAAMAKEVRVMEAPPTWKVRPSVKPRPHTRMTAAMIRFRELVKSTWFSTTFRTPMAEIIP